MSCKSPKERGAPPSNPTLLFGLGKIIIPKVITGVSKDKAKTGATEVDTDSDADVKKTVEMGAKLT